MLELYTSLDSDLISKAAIDEKLATLPTILQTKIASYAILEKQQQRLSGIRLLSMALLANGLDVNLLESIHYNSYGKPFINGEIDFNISYCNNLTVVGFTKNGLVGVDIEQIRAIDFMVYKHYFTQNEWAFIDQNAGMATNFYRLWTRKEAVTKAIGKGVFLDFNTIEVLAETIIVEGKTLTLATTLLENNYCISSAFAL